MVGALASILARNFRQADQPDLATQDIDDAQQIFQSHGGLAGFKIDDEAHANSCGQGQLRLRQAELLAS